MNIADLVTQVQGGEEEEEEVQQQSAGSIDLAVTTQPSSPSSPPADEPATQPSLCQRLFCCLRGDGGKKRKTGGRGDRGHSSVAMHSNANALQGNQNHSRADSTPSISSSGVAMGIQNSRPAAAQPSGRDGAANGTKTAGQQQQQQYHPHPPAQPQQQSSSGVANGASFGAATADNASNQPLPQLRESNNIVTPPPAKYLLGPLPPEDVGKKCLVLDLDETLVHSSFKPIPNADFVISIELEGVIHRVYVRKRPGVDHFMRVVGEKFEVVIFTASLSKYADPLLDMLDRGRVVKARLFREACVQHYGNYVKDLSHLGRRMEDILIVDNSPFSYMFQPDNAIPITSWFNDKNDRQLYELLPFLDTMIHADDVSHVLQRSKPMYNTGIGVPANLLPPSMAPPQ